MPPRLPRAVYVPGRTAGTVAGRGRGSGGSGETARPCVARERDRGCPQPRLRARRSAAAPRAMRLHNPSLSRNAPPSPLPAPPSWCVLMPSGAGPENRAAEPGGEIPDPSLLPARLLPSARIKCHVRARPRPGAGGLVQAVIPQHAVLSGPATFPHRTRSVHTYFSGRFRNSVVRAYLAALL